MPRSKRNEKVGPKVAPPRLGVISNLFGGPPRQVANILSEYGLEAVQLLPSFGPVRLATAEDVNPAACHAMADPFLELGLEVAAVSAHTNFLDPDTQRRQRMIRRFDALIDHCHEFGTQYLVTESATLSPDSPWEPWGENHKPATLKAYIQALAPSVRLAEQAGVTILIEGHACHVVANVTAAQRVAEELGDHVGFVMDPVNYLTKKTMSDSNKKMRELFEAIGERCPLAHGKDARTVGGQLSVVRAGAGVLDYKSFLELLDTHRPRSTLILEQIRPEELRETIDFIDRFFEAQ